MSTQHKRLGYCPITGVQLFEFVAQFPHDHPLAGEPLRLGKPFPHAMRVFLILTSGAHMAVSMSSEGLDKLLGGEFYWPELHKRIMRGFMHEQGTAVFRSGKVTSQKQAQQLRQNMIKLYNSPSIGVLDATPWTQIKGEALDA